MTRTFLTSVVDDRAGRKGGVYGKTQDYIYSIFQSSNFGITDYHKETWDTIKDSPFYYANKALLDDPDAGRNGRAYKPYCVHQAMLKASDGDYIIYTDSSPEMWQGVEIGPQHKLDILKANCNDAGGILSAFVKWDIKNISRGELGIHTHRILTTNICMDTMNMRFYEDAYMPAGGMMVLRKDARTMDFVERWLHYNCDARCSGLGDPNILNDTSYWEPEVHLKTGHRHDQSILGLLLASMDWKFVNIRYNAMNPYNFLQYTLPGPLEFIPALPPVSVGDYVLNKQDFLMRVWRIDPGEKYVVGRHSQSCYNAARHELKLVVKRVPFFTFSGLDVYGNTNIPELLANIFTPQIFIMLGYTREQVELLLLNNEGAVLMFETHTNELPALELLRWFDGWNYSFQVNEDWLICSPIIVPYAHKKI